MTDDQFIDLFNRVASREMFGNFTPITTIDILCEECGLDSMAWMMVGFEVCTWFEVDDEKSKLLHPVVATHHDKDFLVSGACHTLAEALSFLKHHGTVPTYEHCLGTLH